MRLFAFFCTILILTTLWGPTQLYANPNQVPVGPLNKQPSQDPALRAQIRKAAPFWIEDADHGAAIRINKDGSFTSEAQGGGSSAGTWRAHQNQLEISWADGGDKYTYRVSQKGANLILGGQSKKGNRYKLTGQSKSAKGE